VSAIDELKQILTDEEDEAAEYGGRPPINVEITIEAELIYWLIREWPSSDRSVELNRLRKSALSAFSEVYKYLQEEA
jgi:hypothetical protein